VPNRRIHGVVPRLLPWSELTECVTQRFKISGDCHHSQGAAVARHASTGKWSFQRQFRRGFALIDSWTGSSQTPLKASHRAALVAVCAYLAAATALGEFAAAVVGARPSCWAMIAACTTWRSEGSTASGPPATGTCHTWVIIGVEP
jgi:hypothetical protein